MSPVVVSVLRFFGSVATILLVSLLVDMGIKYKLQLVFAAANRGSRDPTYRVKPALRHVVLLVAVGIGVHLYQSRIAELTVSVFVLIAVLGIYVVLLQRDAIKEMESSDTVQ